MTESAKQRKEREAAEAQTTDVAEESVQPFKLAEEGFDVTQAPSSQDDLAVDYKKTTMPVTGDPNTPADFDPASNR